MVHRRWWQQKIEQVWRERSIIWLSGVRRVGKTLLCQSLDQIEYFDCELPRTRRLLDDPEAFLDQHRRKRLILDEVHRLPNPSELLKIAADHYRDTQIVATGSSTLGASSKFRDTLAGRKAEVWLTPMTLEDLSAFGNPDLRHRLLHGGLPPLFLAGSIPESAFQEWMDSYWAKDIQSLFRLERRHSFERFAELLFAQSGGLFEATRFTRACEVSRQTIMNYLAVLESTYLVHVLRPFSTHRTTEIVSAPKVYAFDSGFTCYYRGWNTLRQEDLGYLWEHLVLNELQAYLQTRRIGYWRDKRGHEVDFVLARRAQPPLAIECKWSAEDVDLVNLKAFAHQYPKAKIYVVAEDVERTYQRRSESMTVTYCSLSTLLKSLTG
ncbi:MAG: ATP-binding protein [Nitrospiraceae bacterium]